MEKDQKTSELKSSTVSKTEKKRWHFLFKK
jgi:hypothetical protein